MAEAVGVPPPQRDAAKAGTAVAPTREVSATSAVLARAFHEDPLFVWAFPDPVRRARALASGFRTPVGFTLARGAALAASGHAAVSLWIPPGHAPAPTAALLRHGAAKWPFLFGLRGFARIARVMDAMDGLHHENAPAPHWYLWLLGADPARQGRGFGTALLRAGLARVDTEGLPCYLETFEPRNVPLYRRHGFDVVQEWDPPGGAPRMWAMLRPARP